jgi:hypothetical protein
VDVVVAVDDIGFAQQGLEQRDRGLDAVDDKLVERALQAHQRLGADPTAPSRIKSRHPLYREAVRRFDVR